MKKHYTTLIISYLGKEDYPEGRKEEILSHLRTCDECMTKVQNLPEDDRKKIEESL